MEVDSKIEAVKLYTLAAEAGNAVASSKLGRAL